MLEYNLSELPTCKDNAMSMQDIAKKIGYHNNMSSFQNDIHKIIEGKYRREAGSTSYGIHKYYFEKIM